MLHYHDLNNLSFNQDKNASADLKIGYYGFHYSGGWVTGRLKRIGADIVSIDSPVMGKIEMKTLEFLDSGFQKL